MRILLIGFTILAALPAGAAEVAVLPISAEGALAETAFGIETALRREVEANHSSTLLARDVTTSRVTGAASAGVKCAFTDAPCLKELGELASFTEMILPELKTLTTEGAVLWIGVYDVTNGMFTGRAEGNVALEQPQRQADVRRILRKALGLPDEAVSTVEAPTGTTTSTGTATSTGTENEAPTETIEVMGGGEPEQPPEPSSMMPLILVGVGGAAAVFTLVGLGTAGAVWAYSAFAWAPNDASPTEKYGTAQALSAAIYGGLFAAALGGAAAIVFLGTGAALFAAEFE